MNLLLKALDTDFNDIIHVSVSLTIYNDFFTITINPQLKERTIKFNGTGELIIKSNKIIQGSVSRIDMGENNISINGYYFPPVEENKSVEQCTFNFCNLH